MPRITLDSSSGAGRRIEDSARTALLTVRPPDRRPGVPLNDGDEHAITIHAIYGHPAAALTEAENFDKFARNCSYARPPVVPELRDRLIALVEDWENIEDLSLLPRLLVAGTD